MATYLPTKEEEQKRSKRYKQLQQMRELKEQKFPHFAGPNGQRSFLEYIDNSERILNGYTLSREEQEKEKWQSNMLDNITRAKLRGIVSSVGLKVPEMQFQAVNGDGVRSPVRAELFKHIVKQSYLDGNPIMHNFLETWTTMSHGVIFEYEGYKTGGANVRVVDSFNSRTGEIKEKSKYVEGCSKPYSVILNPQEFYWHDMFVRDLQEQPAVAWVQHFTKKQLETEFSKFPNYKFVKDKKTSSSLPNNTLYFGDWSKRVEKEDDFEVFRFYSKEEDCYEVWVNGVPVLLAPLLWGDEEKFYPFAKSIAEPFANTNFFVGMSLPGILEAYQDAKNTIINTMIDKLYRSATAGLLVGLQNKDLLDFESEFISQDNRYYVPDVTQVKPLPIAGPAQGEFAMLQVIDRGLNSLSVDRNQMGITTGGQKTARESVIADRNAQQLKTMLYTFQEDLWLQKTRLRTRIILTHFIKDVAARTDKKDNIISIKDYGFGTGERGTLDIHVAKSKDKLLSAVEIEAREQAAEEQGEAYKIVSMPVSYLDDYYLDFSIVPESFHNQDKTAKEADFKEEISLVTTLFPEFFVANKDKYLADALALFGKHPDEYNPPAEPPSMMPTDMASGQQPNPQEQPALA